YYSADGLNWFFAFAAFEDYCIGILQGVEDGKYGYDKGQDLVITTGNVLPDINSNIAVAITNASTKPEYFEIDVGLDVCQCVAYMGGIWMAGGRGIHIPDKDGNILPSNFSGTTSSVDGGYTWFPSTYGAISNESGESPPEGFQIETISPAPL